MFFEVNAVHKAAQRQISIVHTCGDQGKSGHGVAPMFCLGRTTWTPLNRSVAVVCSDRQRLDDERGVISSTTEGTPERIRRLYTQTLPAQCPRRNIMNWPAHTFAAGSYKGCIHLKQTPAPMMSVARTPTQPRVKLISNLNGIVAAELGSAARKLR